MKKVVVIGIGIFGFNVAKELYENGIEVIAIDKDKDVIQEVKDFVTKAIISDGLDKGLLESLGLRENDVVIISFGEDLAASTLITLHLKHLKIRNIMVKAPNVEYKQVLESVGATEVIIPEKEMASKIARSLVSPNILDYIPLTEDYMIGEIIPPGHFLGKTLAEARLRSKYNVNVIAIRDMLTDTLKMVPPNYVVKDSEVLVVIGKSRDIDRLK